MRVSGHPPARTALLRTIVGRLKMFPGNRQLLPSGGSGHRDTGERGPRGGRLRWQVSDTPDNNNNDNRKQQHLQQPQHHLQQQQQQHCFLWRVGTAGACIHKYSLTLSGGK